MATIDSLTLKATPLTTDTIELNDGQKATLLSLPLTTTAAAADAIVMASAAADATAKVAAEATTRNTADSNLQTEINNEVAARAAAINSEASTRASADSALQTAINQEVADRAAAINTVSNDLATHIAATSVHGAVSTATASRIVTRDSSAAAAFGGVDLDTTTIASAFKQGRMRWNDTDKCAEVDVDTDVTVQIGQELTIRARNTTGSTLANGTPVYINGATGNRPTVAKADADALATAQTLIGLVTDTAGIANNTDGFVTVFGLVRDLDTSAYSEGATLYLSAGTAGTLTATKPTTEGEFVTRVGFVARSHVTQGTILVSPHYHGSVTGDAVMNAVSKAAARTAIDATHSALILTATAPLRINGGGSGDLTANRTFTVNAATSSATGVVELATPAEVVTGTSTTLAVTPEGDKAALDARIAPLLEQTKSANFTAVAGESYVITASATVTDPASPVNGQSYRVRVSSGTATVGGLNYTSETPLITRAYNGGAWENIPTIIAVEDSANSRMFIGETAGNSTMSGTANIAVGKGAGASLTTGEQNVLMGENAGASMTAGRESVMIGYRAGEAFTSTGVAVQDGLHVFIGSLAGLETTTAIDNVAIGQKALTNNTDGSANVAVGAHAYATPQNGDANTVVGAFAMDNGSAAAGAIDRNVAIGYGALRATNGASSNNVAVGYNAGVSQTQSSGNVFVGHSSGSSNTTGTRNTYVGENTGQDAVTSNDNVLIGNQAGKDITTSSNTAVGSGSLSQQTSGINTAVGYNTGRQITTGGNNSLFGTSTGDKIVTGANNSAFGHGALLNGTGDHNTCVGYLAGSGITTGGANIVLGFQSGPSTGTGNHNIIMGFTTGNGLTSGENNVIIGNYADVDNSGRTNVTLIGYQATSTASNQVVLGNASVTSTILRGAVTATGGIVGNASTATALATARTINGVSFDGTANITVPAVKLTGYTVGTLPAGTVGDVAYVTDATAPTYLGVLVGGGAVVTPVFYNGTAWVSH